MTIAHQLPLTRSPHHQGKLDFDAIWARSTGASSREATCYARPVSPLQQATGAKLTHSEDAIATRPASTKSSLDHLEMDYNCLHDLQADNEITVLTANEDQDEEEKLARVFSLTFRRSAQLVTRTMLIVSSYVQHPGSTCTQCLPLSLILLRL